MVIPCLATAQETDFFLIYYLIESLHDQEILNWLMDFETLYSDSKRGEVYMLILLNNRINQ